jgi:MFS family permease
MALYLTFALMLSGFASVNSGRVLLTLYALQLGAQPTAIGLLGATIYAFPLVLSWPVGRAADRIGSRGLLFFGALCGSAGLLLPYFLHDLRAMYVAAAAMGVSFSFYSVLLQNLVGLLSKPHERTRNYSNFGLCGATTAFLGPLIAGFGIDHFGYAHASLLIAGLALLHVLLLAAGGHLLPAGSRKDAARGRGIGEMLAQPGVVRMLATSGMVQLGQDLFLFYLPVYGRSIGLTASAIGVVLASFAVAAFIVRIVMPRLVAWLKEERLLAYSFLLGGAALVLVPLFSHVALLSIAAFAFGIGMGCGQPLTMMLMFNRSAPGRSGETLGLRMTANNIMRVGGPALFGVIATALGLTVVFWLDAALLALTGALSRPRSREAQVAAPDPKLADARSKAGGR